MDSTSTPGDFVSEELQEVATAASLNTATTRLQATEVQSQPVQHGGDEKDVQARGFFHHGLASDSDEAESVGENANLNEDEHPHTHDFEDDTSMDTEILIDQRLNLLNYGKEQSSEMVAKYKQHGDKYARVAALYTEGLESRVHAVERELLELQYELGSKERPNEGRQVTFSILSFYAWSCSCSNFAVN